jgi:hypothetical protein
MVKALNWLILILLCVSIHGLPDAKCTPGAVNPDVTQGNIQTTICRPGYTRTIRPSSYRMRKVEAERMKAYGAKGTRADYELDHLISLEIGGCPDCSTNLWPEPYKGKWNAHDKDKVENALHRAVCSGRMSLREAQEIISTDWRRGLK